MTMAKGISVVMKCDTYFAVVALTWYAATFRVSYSRQTGVLESGEDFKTR